MQTMTTWSSSTWGTIGNTTTWFYDAYRGWLSSKRYADNQGPDYYYTAAGRLQYRDWARGLRTTYSYNNAGELASVGYGGGSTGVAFAYDRLGRQTTVSQGGSVVVTRTFSSLGSPLSESYSGGPLRSLDISH
jgi:hypothetical protein